ncbi:hypothetical protein G9464_02545 [Halostella sp. JP-L12]|uniref:hypothetical protein n=1 Tax=Halostella TaxID=1843185 RepID=UPI0013CEBDED|nr:MULTISPECIES: hypothetical protein [Halostella]NHN46481.1 hypothetical protein [Halostella sp. JP-L12]
MKSGLKIGLTTIFLAAAISLYLHTISIADFAAQHAEVVSHSQQTGHLSTNGKLIEAFYSYGIVFIQILGVKGSNLLTFPFLVWPYVAILFTTSYQLSNNYKIAGSIVFLHFVSGINGTNKLFYWPHGMGAVLFLCVITLLIIFARNFDHYRRIAPAFTIIMTTLMFTSYNWSVIGLSSILALAISIGTLYHWHPDIVSERTKIISMRMLLPVIAISIILITRISEFIYTTAVPMVLRVHEISSISKFLGGWLGANTLPEELSEIYLVRPEVLTYLSIFKYIIVGLVLSSFGIMMLRRLQNRKLHLLDFLISSFIVGTGVFITLRLTIGSIPIPWLHFPTILCLAYCWRLQIGEKIWKRVKIRRVFVVIALGGLLLQAPLFYAANAEADLINRTDGLDDYKVASSFIGEYLDDPIYSTQKPRYLLSMYLTEKFGESGKKPPTRVMQSEDVINIREHNNIEKGSFVINYEWNHVVLGNYISLESWRSSEERINSHPGVNKVYVSEETYIYISK